MDELFQKIGEFIESETGWCLTSTLKEEFEGDLEELLEKEYNRGYKDGINDSGE